MNTKSWPYGTTKQGTVIQVSRVQGGFNILFMESVGNKTEAFFLVFPNDHAESNNAKPGDKGAITFKQGGPYGGYWDYAATAAA